MDPTTTIDPGQTLAHLAATRAGASRVFGRHGLDFCCHGHVSIEAACADRGLDVEQLVEELAAEEREDTGFESWTGRPLEDLVDHILRRYHEPAREEFQRLLAMARKVETVHADKTACPHGLADHLGGLCEALELHMQKEEHVLFPLVLTGHGRMALAPVQVMEQEHEDIGRELAHLRRLTADYTPPEGACNTWRALFLGLAELERDLMEHIHLENNVLFPRATTN